MAHDPTLIVDEVLDELREVDKLCPELLQLLMMVREGICKAFYTWPVEEHLFGPLPEPEKYIEALMAFQRTLVLSWNCRRVLFSTPDKGLRTRQLWLVDALASLLAQRAVALPSRLAAANPLFVVNATLLLAHHIAEKYIPHLIPAQIFLPWPIHYLREGPAWARSLVTYLRALLATGHPRAHNTIATVLNMTALVLTYFLPEETERLADVIYEEASLTHLCSVDRNWLYLSARFLGKSGGMIDKLLRPLDRMQNLLEYVELHDRYRRTEGTELYSLAL